MFKCSFCDYGQGEMGRTHINIGKPFPRLESENAAICDHCVKGTKEYKHLETQLIAANKKLAKAKGLLMDAKPYVFYPTISSTELFEQIEEFIAPHRNPEQFCIGAEGGFAPLY